MMFAAVVNSFDRGPTFQEMAAPRPVGEHEALVDVIAVGVHPRVRSQANGSHYTHSHDLPMVPGIDGVGRLPDGRVVYFVLPDGAVGALAQQTVVDLRRAVVLPERLDPVLIAAAMNPAMSSWVGLRHRLEFAPGSQVLVMGAAGNAGQLAIGVAKHFGAAAVIGAGRNRELLARLRDLGADATVSLSGSPDEVADRLAKAASEVDVVIDYLWGPPAEAAVTALLTARGDRGRAMTWLQIGSIAAPTAALPSAAFRSANFRVVGSGQGSVSTADIVAELPELAEFVGGGALTIDPITAPLSEIQEWWAAPTIPGRRLVILPNAA